MERLIIETNGKRFLITSTLVLGLLFAESGMAQLTYIGGGLGYGFCRVNKDQYNVNSFSTPAFVSGDYNYHTDLHQLLFNISVMHRVKRNIIVGFKTTIPLYQGNNFNGFGWSTGDNFYELYDEYAPSRFDYQVRTSAEASILVRWAAANETAPYFEVRGSMLWSKETLVFRRDGPGSSVDVNINNDFTHSDPAIGFALGGMPHISDDLYLDLQFAVDLIMYAGDSFSYDIEYDYESGEYQTFEMASQMDGMKARFSAHFGLGYKF